MSRSPQRRFFRDLPIRHKLGAMMIVVALASTGTGFALVITETIRSFRANELARLEHLAAVAADFSIAPITFDDPKGAAQRLSYLDNVPGVVGAVILNKQGGLFAQSGAQIDPATAVSAEPRSRGLLNDRLEVQVPIEFRGEVLGSVTVRASPSRLWRQIWRYLLVMGGILVVVSVLAAVLAYRLQRTLSRPILELAKVTRTISQQGDYGIRVQRDARDELAGLFTGFNQMIAEIQRREQERDRAQCELRVAHSELEARVEERTRALRTANEILNSEVEERYLAEDKVRSALQEKEVLLREIHHRVKNNLYVVYSLLSLQMGESAARDPDAALDDSRQRVRTMAMVHENLYRADDLSRVNAAEFTHKITKDLSLIFGVDQAHIRIQAEVDDVFLSLDQAIPVGLILNELLTNALKYAFPAERRGVIRVELRQMGDRQVMLAVEDDGIGFPASLDLDNPTSLGMKLVQALVGQLHGTMTTDWTRGARFEISFGLIR